MKTVFCIFMMLIRMRDRTLETLTAILIEFICDKLIQSELLLGYLFAKVVTLRNRKFNPFSFANVQVRLDSEHLKIYSWILFKTLIRSSKAWLLMKCRYTFKSNNCELEYAKLIAIKKCSVLIIFHTIYNDEDERVRYAVPTLADL